jgi:hypothetical protein
MVSGEMNEVVVAAITMAFVENAVVALTPSAIR